MSAFVETPIFGMEWNAPSGRDGIANSISARDGVVTVRFSLWTGDPLHAPRTHVSVTMTAVEARELGPLLSEAGRIAAE